MTKKSKNFTQSDTHHMGWISYVGLLSNEILNYMQNCIRKLAIKYPNTQPVG